ncbi:hypothetical protein N9F18_00380, partial [bacterium]|nr:hypothetical protein [bacterium]
MKKPKLALIPSGYGDGKLYSVMPTNGSGDFAFSRGSGATRINKDGLIETITDKLGDELITNGYFSTDSDWTKPAGVTISSGKLNFSGVASNASSAQVGVFTNGLDYRISFTISNFSSGSVRIIAGSGGTGISSTYAADGNYSVILNGGGDLVMYFQSINGVTSLSIDNVSVKQVTAGLDTPRLDYPLIDGVVNGCPSVLLEPQRTNLVTYSEDFSNAYWTKTSSNTTSNAIISPDGGLNGTKYTLDTTISRSQISRSIFSIGTLYTASVFVKYDSVKYFYISNAGANAYRVVFDIENGTIVSNGASITSSKIENYGNGWYRCSSVFTAAYSTLYLKNSPNSNGATFTNTTDFNYIYGAQLEEGSYPTSYIPTQGSVVTRLADVCTNGGNEQVINSTEGVLYAEMSALADDLSERRFGLSDGTSSNVIRIGYTNVSNRIIAVIYNGSNQAFLTYTSPDITQNSKI